MSGDEEPAKSSAVEKLTKARRKYSLQAKYPGKLEGLDVRGRTTMAERMLTAWSIKDKSGITIRDYTTEKRVTGTHLASIESC